MNQEPTAEQKPPSAPEPAAEQKASAEPQPLRLVPALSTQDWRVFGITFVAGIGSIVVGAALIGLALALARIFENNLASWLVLALYVFLGVGCVIGGQLVWRYARPSPGLKSLFITLVWTGYISIGIAVLVLIGKAAGIH